MYKYVLIIVLGLVIAASAQSFLTPETHFFGIPNIDSLSSPWFLNATDSVCSGLVHPVDVDVIKLSAYDYRLVILDAINHHFTTIRIDQQNGVQARDIIQSSVLMDSAMDDAAAMCLIQRSTYFDSETDRIAVVFWEGAKVGIFRFESWSSDFVLERVFSNPEITKPIGLFWAFDQFFIVDEATESIVRTDSLGNIISRYGFRGLSVM